MPPVVVMVLVVIVASPTLGGTRIPPDWSVSVPLRVSVAAAVKRRELVVVLVGGLVVVVLVVLGGGEGYGRRRLVTAASGAGGPLPLLGRPRVQRRGPGRVGGAPPHLPNPRHRTPQIGEGYRIRTQKTQ